MTPPEPPDGDGAADVPPPRAVPDELRLGDEGVSDGVGTADPDADADEPPVAPADPPVALEPPLAWDFGF